MLLFSILFSILSPFKLRAAPDTTPINILILNSYSDNLWTDNLNEGILNSLKTLEDEYVTYTESLDFKRFPEAQYQELKASQFLYKYKDIKIDIIITTDDQALTFALFNRKEMFSDAPIVFTGVHKTIADHIMESNDRLTGVYEEIDVITTIKYAKELTPNFNKVYVLSELTETAKNTEASIFNDIHNNAPELNLESLSNYSFDELVQIIPNLDSNSILLLGPYSIDKSNQHLGGLNLTKRFSEISRVPIYVLYDFEFGTGALGGNILMGKLQGGLAGEFAITILHTKNADAIEPVLKESYQALFDYNAMQKYNIQLKNLPKGSLLINYNMSFFEQYQTGVIIVSLIFLFLILSIAILSFNIRKRKIAEMNLKSQNNKISELYETVTISEEELKAQYDELWGLKNYLALSEERYRLVAEASKDIIWDLDLKVNTIYFPERLFEISGLKNIQTNMDYCDFIKIIHPMDIMIFETAISLHMEGKVPNIETEIRLETGNDDYLWFSVNAKAIWDEKNLPIRISGCFTDITEKRQNLKMIEELAYFDSLTELKNHAGFLKDLHMLHSNALAKNLRYALIYINLDNFKDLNDTFGHDLGNEVLIQVTQKMNQICDVNSQISKSSCDDFILILNNATDDSIHSKITEILNICNERLIINDKTIYLSINIGVSIYPDHSTEYEALIRYADIAMYVAKSEGKMGYKIFTNALFELLEAKIKLSEDIRVAIDEEQFCVYYQPEVDSNSRKIHYLEALIRWNHPEKGVISPLEFIPMAEETGQIIQIGFFVLREVLKFKKKINGMGMDHISISINISVKQLNEKNFVEQFTEIVLQSEIQPEKIIIEVTESIFIDSFFSITKKLSQLKDSGFKIALDDFGTGYSSLSYLLRLPIHILKIDKSFIDRIHCNDMSRSLIISIIQIAHNLGLEVVAEGVDNIEKLNFLQNHNCNYIQGYYFSKPLSEEDITKKLCK